MEVTSEDHALEFVFRECQELYQALTSTLLYKNDSASKETAILLEKKAKRCEVLIRREHLFSVNETIKDMNTEDIRFLLIGYYLGFVLQKGMEDRLTRLHSAASYLESFLDVLERCEVLGEKERIQYHGYLERNEKKLTADGSLVREEKIQRARDEKECENRLAEIAMMEKKKEKGGIVDEDMEREKWILALQSCSRKALNDLHMIPQETSILEYMEKMKEKGENPRDAVIKEYTTSGKKDMEVIRIGTDMSVSRETIKASVFRPWWNLPTRSMADYAEEEYYHMKEAEREREEEVKPDKRMKQLEEEGLEDDEELVEKATLRDRHYEDWMDDISKGIGNTKRISLVSLTNTLN